jgi:hypothetical protein
VTENSPGGRKKKKRSRQWRASPEKEMVRWGNSENVMDPRKRIYCGEDNDEGNVVVVVEFTGTPWFGRKISSNLHRKSSSMELRRWIYDAMGGSSRM